MDLGMLGQVRFIRKYRWTITAELPYWLKKNQSKFYGTVDLKLYDGCGVMMETWHLDGAYVKGVAFSELDHSSNDSDYIEMEWGYNSVKYIPAIERDLASLKMQIIAKNPTITGFAIPSTNT